MKISAMFPRKFVSGEELGGKAFAVTIEEVRAEQMQMQGGKPEQKFVLYLVGTRKGIILSRTLAEQIQEIVGSDETQDWAGHKILIFPVPMKVAGKDRVAIRARAVKAIVAGAETPAGGVAEQAAELKDEEAEE